MSFPTAQAYCGSSWLAVVAVVAASNIFKVDSKCYNGEQCDYIPVQTYREDPAR